MRGTPGAALPRGTGPASRPGVKGLGVGTGSGGRSTDEAGEGRAGPRGLLRAVCAEACRGQQTKRTGAAQATAASLSRGEMSPGHQVPGTPAREPMDEADQIMLRAAPLPSPQPQRQESPAGRGVGGFPGRGAGRAGRVPSSRSGRSSQAATRTKARDVAPERAEALTLRVRWPGPRSDNGKLKPPR